MAASAAAEATVAKAKIDDANKKKDELQKAATKAAKLDKNLQEPTALKQAAALKVEKLPSTSPAEIAAARKD